MRKIYQDSIDLLQRTEKLALQYSDKGFYLAFSGGKDSQCLYHIAKLAGVKFEAHMNLTSIDPPEVIRFVRTHYPDVICHKPEDSIFNMTIKKKFLLPSRIIRWCCAELKEKGGAGTVCLTGVRKAESARRAKRNSVEVSDRSFLGTYDEFTKWQEEAVKKKVKNLNQDQFGEQGETVVRCISGKDKIIVNPIIEWSDRDVWGFLNHVVKVEHCKLYDRGYTRIGCICCPVSRPNAKLREIQEYPHVKRNWIKVIKTIRSDGHDNLLTNADFGNGTEDEKCENVFNWWISGKSYEEWYADTFRQLRFDFEDYERNELQISTGDHVEGY